MGTFDFPIEEPQIKSFRAKMRKQEDQAAQVGPRTLAEADILGITVTPEPSTPNVRRRPRSAGDPRLVPDARTETPRLTRVSSPTGLPTATPTRVDPKKPAKSVRISSDQFQTKKEYEDFVSNQDLDTEIVVGITFEQSNDPVYLNTLARVLPPGVKVEEEQGPFNRGLGPSTGTRAIRALGVAADVIGAPFEAIAETGAELTAQVPKIATGRFGDIDAPTLLKDGFVASVEDHRKRSIVSQVTLGIVFDPFVLAKAFTIPVKASRPVIRNLVRAQVAQAAPNTPRRTLDDAVETIIEQVSKRELTDDEFAAYVDDVIAREGEAPIRGFRDETLDLSPLEQAELRLDMAEAHLEATQATGAPVPKFGTRERAEFDVALRDRAVPNKAQRVQDARAKVNEAKINLEEVQMAPRTSVQGELGIGEGAQQTGMDLGGAGRPLAPLIDPEEVAAQGRRAAEGRAGQRALPEGTGGGPPTGRPPIPPGSPPPVVPTPDGGSELLPPVVNNIINLQPIRIGLTRGEKVRDLAADTIGRPFRATRLSDIATPANRERARVRGIIDTQANILGARTRATVSKVFDLDDNGRILNLDGVDPSLPSAPTIQDVAARLPRFLDKLTPEQLRALRQIESEVVPYRNLFDELGIEVSKRSDVMEGGFYLPRGNALLEGADEPVRSIARRPRGKAGFEKGAVFDSMAQGLDSNFQYTPLDEALQGYAQQAGSRALDEHYSNFFKAVREEGVLVGETPKMRMLRQNPKLVEVKKGIDRNLNRLKSLFSKLRTRQQKVIDDFILDPDFDDIDALRKTLEEIKVQRGPSAGANIAEIQAFLKQVKADVRAVQPEWNRALTQARQTPRGQATIEVAQLNNRTYPVEVANAANAVLKAEKATVSPLEDTARVLNNLYRGFNATGDNSALGVQGLLGLASDPAAYKEALKVNLLAWGRGGDEVLGRFMLTFDDKAAKTGRLRSIGWGQEGLHIGGQDTEYLIGRGATSFLNKIPGIRQANRAFGYFGDALRLQWADDELERLLRLTGDPLDSLRQSGEVRKIAEAINGATGYSPGKTFGNVGDLVLFAPRFMQARLETTARAAMSLRPGASLDQRLARRSLLKSVGYGTLLTFAVNEMLGNDTDIRPVVNGRYNSNFMRIRVAGRDVSVFGTWDLLPRAIISTAQGRPQDILRSSGSGIVSMTWDFLGNKNFFGEAVRDNPAQFAKWILGHVTPFAADELLPTIEKLVDKDFVGGITTALLEIVGAKSSPLSGREATNVARQAQMEAEGLTGLFEDLPPMRQVEIDETPAVKGAKAAWEDQQRKRQSEFRAYADERDSINDKFKETVSALADRVGPSLEFRKDLSVHQMLRARDQAQLKVRSSEALEWLKDKEPGKAIESQALDVYATLIFDPELEDLVTFDYDFTERDRRLVLLRRKFGDEVINGVEEFIHRNEHPLVTELREDRVILEPYWQIRDTLVLPRLTDDQRRVYQRWLNEGPRGKSELTDNPEFRAIVNAAERLAGRQQQIMRVQRPEINAVLLKWEYSASRQFRRFNEFIEANPPAVATPERELLGVGQ